MTTAFMKANPTIKVENTLVAYEALHDKIVAAAPAGTYDVVLMDCIWPAEFAKKHVVADISDKVKALSGLSGIFPGAIQTAQYEGKYYGMPWLLDTKYLFYNTEMLQKAGIKPEQLATWDGVKSAAQALKAKNIVKYPLIGSWAQAEAVVCDYAALVGAFGGSFLDAAGKPAFTSGGGLQALQFMRDLISSGLANPASAESIEDDVVKTFSQGNAAIALNWTFMYGQANDPKASKVAGKVGMLRTPAGPGGKAPGVNGASALAITSGSQHQDAAWEYVKYLTSQSVQDKFATSSLPIWKASYDEPAVQKAGTPAVVSVAKNPAAGHDSSAAGAELQRGLAAVAGRHPEGAAGPPGPGRRRPDRSRPCLHGFELNRRWAARWLRLRRPPVPRNVPGWFVRESHGSPRPC